VSGKKGQGTNSILSVHQLISQLAEKTIKQRPESGLELLVQQRVNQQVVDQLLGLWHSKKTVPEVRSVVFASLNSILQWLNDNNDHRKYKPLSAHFKLLEQQIDFSLEQGKQVVNPKKVNMPPGSPIGG